MSRTLTVNFAQAVTGVGYQLYSAGRLFFDRVSPALSYSYGNPHLYKTT